jgi:formate dehydrogenase subunit gamma
MATTPPDGGRILRWTRTERAVHWVHATAFCILLTTGLCLYLPSLAQLVGRRPLLKHIHLYTAASWSAVLLAIVLVGDRRSLLRTVREVDLLSMPSRMNRGQKLNTIVTAAFAILFAVSGFDLWLGERNTRFRVANALLVHDWLMYLSFFLFVGHLYFSLVLPSTRHSLSGMTRGWVRADWAARHHPEWVESELGPANRRASAS